MEREFDDLMRTEKALFYAKHLHSGPYFTTASSESALTCNTSTKCSTLSTLPWQDASPLKRFLLNPFIMKFTFESLFLECHSLKKMMNYVCLM